MSWFSISDYAKSALSEAQKKIDKALDIQAKEERETTVTKTDDSQSNPITLDKEEPRPIKQANFSSKKKARTPKPVNNAFKAKKITDDIGDDFFSVLDNRKTKSQVSKASPSKSTFTEVSDSTRKDSLKGLEAGSAGASSESENVIVSDNSGASDFVDVPLFADSLMTAEDSSSNQEEYKHDTVDISKSNDSVVNDGNEAANSENLAETFENLKLSSERTVSPSISTAASSEIDILDHDSITSEVSSKYDGRIQIPSAINLVNADGIDSDASQALSPLPDDKYTDRAPLTTPLETDSPNNTFQPVHHPDAQETLESSSAIGEDPNEAEYDESDDIDCLKQSSEVEEIGDANVASGEKSQSNKYTELSEKTEVYEQQLMTLSYKNAQLNEENDNLRSEIIRTKEECEKQASKMNENVTNSLKLSENSNKLLAEENDNLKKQMIVLKSQLASRMTHEQVQTAISEKEESIKGLMEEGEVLAKKHLQQNNLIKKLKTQGQDREAELKTLREKFAKIETENSKIKTELKQAQGQGREERETSLRISDAYEQREKETQLLQEKLSQSEEKQRTFQVNLDAAYKEIGDLHKLIAEQESKSSLEWKSKEEDMNREHELEKKKILSEQEHQKQLLMLQIMELNNSVSRSEAAASRKDDDHRREIRELQQRIQESEGRNQDLSDNVSNATRPLLRQIENLQATHSSQQRSWNALEKTLNNRLGEAQAELLAARENERIAQNTLIEAKSKALAYEKQVESSQSTVSQQVKEIEILQKKVDEYKNQTTLLSEELDELRTSHKEVVHKSRKERLFLENQLQMEKVRLEAERKKFASHQEAMQKEKDRMMWSRSEITSVSSQQLVETESIGSSNEAFHSTETFEKHLSSNSLPGLVSQLSFDSGKPMSSSNVLENLQTMIKLRDGEIAQLRGDINMLERTRSSMAEEIVRLTNLNEDLDGVSKELQAMKGKLAEVEGRYSAILTMYGEKEEENEELRMDLADVKAMYRQQINDLLKVDPS